MHEADLLDTAGQSWKEGQGRQKSDLTSLCYLLNILPPDELTVPLEYPQPLLELL